MHANICFDIYTAQDLITLITAVQLQCVCTILGVKIFAQNIISKISNEWFHACICKKKKKEKEKDLPSIN